MIIKIVTILTVIIPILIQIIMSKLLLCCCYDCYTHENSYSTLHYVYLNMSAFKGNSIHSSSLGAISEVQVMETWYSQHHQVSLFHETRVA